MVDNSKEGIITLYQQYGFSFREEISTAEVMVFSYNEGYFSNADLLIIQEDSESVKKVKTDLESLGFSVRERVFKTLEDTHQRLFDGFFKVPQVEAKLKKTYDTFVAEQSEQLGYSYEFVEPKYSVISEDQNLASNSERMIDYVKGILKSKGAKLIILEAAAGFGKTCASYELLKEIISDTSLGSVIFTELSRNRTVKLFKYVLLSEIDSIYANKIKMDLAVKELENGNVCLLIDGFDELLTKKNTGLPIEADNALHFKDAESMLETIGELLKGDAKIILTSRRTAIFSGDEFAEWMESRNKFFSVERLSINLPAIKNWFPVAEKYERVTHFPQTMLSPFFLGLLRGLDNEKFDQVLGAPEALMNLYLDRILEREKTRQDLRLTTSDQKIAFQRLAVRMAEFGTLVDTKEAIKEFFKTDEVIKSIVEKNLATYSSTDNVSLEDLLGKLSNHALLDRSPKGNGGYGFVNEHILGYLLGSELISSPRAKKILVDERFIDLVARSALSREEKERVKLWEQLDDSIILATNEEQIVFDAMFLNELKRSFSACTLSDVEVDDCDFTQVNFNHVVFERCRFSRCTFRQETMLEVQFVGCQFHECSVVDYMSTTNEVVLYSSEDSPFFKITDTPLPAEEYIDYEVKILKQFQKPEKGFITHRLITQIYKNFSRDEYRMVDKAIAKLETIDVLEKKGAHVYFVFANLSKAQDMLKKNGGANV